MAKDQIKKLLDASADTLEKDFQNFENTIKNDLKTFKKKTLDRI